MEYVIESTNTVVFSEREVCIIREYAGGKKVSDIAKSLSLSPRTVEAAMADIREKVGVKTTVQVVAEFIRKKIID